MKIWIICFLATLILFDSCSRIEKVRQAEKSGVSNVRSMATELRAFYDIGSLPNYRDNTICAQISSYDTTGGNDDGFSGRFSSLGKDRHGNLILFDVKGGGVINRIWTPTPNSDTLDFFIDDTLKPAFSICYTDLFSGKVYPFTGPLCGNQLGGYFCYIPIPFGKSCRITSRGKKEQFHQIQYRLYEQGVRIRSFSMNLLPEDKEAICKTDSLFMKEGNRVKDFYTGNLIRSSKEVVLSPGKSITIFETHRGGRIAGIELSPASEFEGIIKDTDIRITWDGENEPAVYCAVPDFFGFAFGSQSMQSLLLGSRNNIMYSYIPMPFDRSARIELTRRDNKIRPGEEIRVKADIWYSDDKRIPGKEGKFYTQWSDNITLQYGKPHIIANVKGKGHFIGTILQAQGLKAGMTIFFEGDDSTSIDGKFRMHGTGSEDYFNGGWYALMDRWDNKMSLPLHGSLEYSLPFCRTGGYRFYIADKLSFEKSFFQSIEHGTTENSFPAAYTSFGLFYCDSPPSPLSLPPENAEKIYMPDTLVIYPQLIDFNLYGSMDIRTTWRYGTGGESYLFTPVGEAMIRISLRDIPAGNYSVYFDIIKNAEGCNFSLWQRQKQVSPWLSSKNTREERTDFIYLCDILLSEISRTITIHFNTDKGGRSLLLNRIILIKK
jgi:hypothetical protein